MTQRRFLLTLLAITIAVIALAVPAFAQRAAMAQAPPQRLSMDATLAEINDMVPGFGGLFVDADGLLTVYLRSENGLQQRRLFGPDVRVLDADFEFRQLLGWRDAMRDLLATPGMVLLDADESLNRVRVGLETGSPRVLRALLSARLAALGVPRDAVVFEEVDPIHEVVTLRDAFNPVPGGVEIHWSNFLCTLGFNVKRGADTDVAQACFFVTNDHCTDVQGSVTGTTYRQPAFGVQIGVEVLDPPFFSGGVCPAGRICRYSDAALARYNNPADCELGKIARTTGLGSITVDPANPRWTIVAKLPAAKVGQIVSKTGRTTGWSVGRVTDTCVDTNVSGGNITRLCQSIAQFIDPAHIPIVGGGDSGSPVFLTRELASQAGLVGILWGSDGAGTLFVFSPVENIEKELGFALTVH